MLKVLHTPDPEAPQWDEVPTSSTYLEQMVA